MTVNPPQHIQPRCVPNGYDVGRLAGVSQSAVSRALRPGGGVSEKTRQKVVEAAKQLGYFPNHLARAMITRQTSVIAIVISGATTIYYPEVLGKLCDAIAARNCRAMVFIVDADGIGATSIDAIVSQRVDAAITLVSLSSIQIDLLNRFGIRLICYNRDSPNHVMNAVTCDHRRSGRDVAIHLMELGHKACAIIAGPNQSSVSSERIDGVKAARFSNAARYTDAYSLLISCTETGDYSYESGLAATRAFEKLPQLPQAIVACNDAMAAAAIDVVRLEWGLVIGRDVSVVGFDGAAYGGWNSYQLTTVLQPVERLCAAAVDMSVNINAQKHGERRIFNTSLRIGATTGSPALCQDVFNH